MAIRFIASQSILGSLSISGDGSNATTLTESGVGEFDLTAVSTISLNVDSGVTTALSLDGSSGRGTFKETIELKGITNGGADTDKFLNIDTNGLVTYRTGDQVRSDIGAGIGSGTVHLQVVAQDILLNFHLQPT